MRLESKVYILGIANNSSTEVKALLELPEGYWITAQSAVAIAAEIMNDKIATRGFLTPAGAFGSDFILQFEHTKRSDL